MGSVLLRRIGFGMPLAPARRRVIIFLVVIAVALRSLCFRMCLGARCLVVFTVVIAVATWLASLGSIRTAVLLSVAVAAWLVSVGIGRSRALSVMRFSLSKFRVSI